MIRRRVITLLTAVCAIAQAAVPVFSASASIRFVFTSDAHYGVTRAHFRGHDNTFRVDSPMKGAVSADDETRLSFHVASIDTATLQLTVRECLWNATPDAPSLSWGDSRTVSLSR
jgi:hypothetical protein